MEFRFNVNDIFKSSIVEIGPSLIPPGTSFADKRALWDAVNKVAEVVNVMGQASATAQGLTKPITTSDRLRNSEQKLYLLIDTGANSGQGAVTGMLKTGKKGLYVFDREGHHYQVQPSCVLDFYIHESKQRMGLGKQLFEHMLAEEKVEPVKLAIDRPSDKFLGFLNKHYALNNPVRQMNNFVVFDGFFPEPVGGQAKGDNSEVPTTKSNQAANGLQSNFSAPFGRRKNLQGPEYIPNNDKINTRVVHLSECIPQMSKNSSTNDEAKPEETLDEVNTTEDEPKEEPKEEPPPPKLERPHSLSLQTSEEQVEVSEVDKECEDDEAAKEEIVAKIKSVGITESDLPSGEKMRTPSHLTEQGYFDLKFYHNKLW